MPQEPEKERVNILDKFLPMAPPYPPLPRVLFERPKETSKAAKDIADAGGAVGKVITTFDDIRKIILGE